MSLALLFPGQGSQYVGMGRELSESFPEAADTFSEANELLGTGLSTLMWEGPDEELVRTKNAQPAILVHSVAAYRVIADRLPPVSMAAGHSLGEFSAHVAAGTIAFADAVRAVRLRGELMYQAGEARPGTMAALLGLDDESAERVCADASRGGDSVVVTANFNSPGQIVISGDVDAVERAMTGAKEAGAKRVVPLSVSGAFHSPLMAAAEEGLREKLLSVNFDAPECPVYSNVTAGPVEDGETAMDLLVRQLTSPVRWAGSIARMVEDGADSFLELGPGTVLSGLNRRNARGVTTRAVDTPDDVNQLSF